MLRFKSEIQPARELHIVDGIECDVCGGTIAPNETRAIISHLARVPTLDKFVPHAEGRRQTNYDVCTVCIEAKLLPWLTSQGVTLRDDDDGDAWLFG